MIYLALTVVSWLVIGYSALIVLNLGFAALAALLQAFKGEDK